MTATLHIPKQKFLNSVGNLYVISTTNWLAKLLHSTDIESWLTCVSAPVSRSQWKWWQLELLSFLLAYSSCLNYTCLYFITIEAPSFKGEGGPPRVFSFCHRLKRDGTSCGSATSDWWPTRWLRAICPQIEWPRLYFPCKITLSFSVASV